MPFLPPNQQRQSTEGSAAVLTLISITPLASSVVDYYTAPEMTYIVSSGALNSTPSICR